MIDPPPPHWFDSLPADWNPATNPADPLIWIDRDTGRMAALVAPHDECILDGSEDYRCITPPRSKTGYEYAHVGATTLSTGARIKTANLGGRVDHAGKRATMSLAQDHYANTATRWARGRYFEDDLGNIWFAGALVPWIDPMQMVEIEGSALSGDWRWIDRLGNLELAGSQLVNVPAFRPSYHGQFSLAASMGGKQVRGMWAAMENTGVCIVARPADGEVTYGDPHVTIAYLGDITPDFDPRPVLEAAAIAAFRIQPFRAKVSGTMNIGKDRVPALLMEAPELQWLRDHLEVFDGALGGNRYPSWIPHLSTSYQENGRTPRKPPESILFDRLAVWAGDDRYDLPLVGEEALAAALGLVSPPQTGEPIWIEDDPDWLHTLEGQEDPDDHDDDDVFVS